MYWAGKFSRWRNSPMNCRNAVGFTIQWIMFSNHCHTLFIWNKIRSINCLQLTKRIFQIIKKKHFQLINFSPFFLNCIIQQQTYSPFLPISQLVLQSSMQHFFTVKTSTKFIILLFQIWSNPAHVFSNTKAICSASINVKILVCNILRQRVSG